MNSQKAIALSVKKVPAFDTETKQNHIAYTVYLSKPDSLQIASAWTLQDAISLFAKIYNYNRSDLKVKRPFTEQ